MGARAAALLASVIGRKFRRCSLDRTLLEGGHVLAGVVVVVVVGVAF